MPFMGLKIRFNVMFTYGCKYENHLQKWTIRNSFVDLGCLLDSLINQIELYHRNMFMYK